MTLVSGKVHAISVRAFSRNAQNRQLQFCKIMEQIIQNISTSQQLEGSTYCLATKRIIINIWLVTSNLLLVGPQKAPYHLHSQLLKNRCPLFRARADFHAQNRPEDQETISREDATSCEVCDMACRICIYFCIHYSGAAECGGNIEFATKSTVS